MAGPKTVAVNRSLLTKKAGGGGAPPKSKNASLFKAARAITTGKGGVGKGGKESAGGGVAAG